MFGQRVRTLWLFVLIAGCAAFMVISLRYASGIVRSWDEVDFVLALDRFDLLAMQPHFPGYPYFVLGGMLVRLMVDNPAKALSVLNVLMAVGSIVPITLLGRKYYGLASSLLAALCVVTLPYLWLLSTQPMSEAAGIAVLWWYLWSLMRDVEKRTMGAMILPLALFGVLMGIRLSFAPFGLGILWLWYVDWRVWQGMRQAEGTVRELEGGQGLSLPERTPKLAYWPRLLFYAIWLVLFQCVWVIGLAMSEGGIFGFVKLASAFVAGHFSEWGGGVAATPMPLAERVARFFGDNVLRTGLLARSAGEAALLGALAALAAGFAWLRRSGTGSSAAEPPQSAGRAPLLGRARLLPLLLALSAAYGAWAFAAQNIAKPRHISPLLGPLLLALLYALLHAAKGHARRQLAAHLLIAATLSFHFVAGFRLIERQATEPPAVHRLASALTEAYVSGCKPFTLYTWEETRVLQYMNVPFDHKRIETYGYFLSEVAASKHRRIFLTDHVLHGFEAQVGSLADRVRLIGVYRSDPLFEPVYDKIEVYEWLRNS